MFSRILDIIAKTQLQILCSTEAEKECCMKNQILKGEENGVMSRKLKISSKAREYAGV